MSFYPPEWDYDRVLNTSADDFMALTDEQRFTLLDGLKEAGLYDGVMEAWRRVREEKDAAAEAAKTEEDRMRGSEMWAPYLDNLNYVFRFTDEWSEWGFVIYRACCYDPAQEDRWAQFRARFDKILDDEVAGYHNYHPKLDRALALRRNIWIEDPALENASPKDISRRYAQIWPTVGRGHSMAVCLMVTQDSVDSVLNSPLPSSAPIEQRKSLPFVVAVDQQAHEMPFEPPPEDEDVDDEDIELPSFRVAVESLMSILWGTIDGDGLALLTSEIKHEKDIWLTRPVWGESVRYYEDTS
ncbi:hypothetical protein KEM56_001577 [Ascosphaera pollenicola]|nr:hypothetical protein KEM56_001577 [Ascosphaera pollenicola]